LVAPDRRGPVLWAVNREASAKGLRPGMRLADARALLAGLATARADAAADRRGLERLALWCNRFTPWCAVDGDGDDDKGGDGGLLLDITGCAHLFGGEAALMNEIAARLTGLGIENRLGLADTPGAACALARFSPAANGRPDARIAAPGELRTAIAGLPVEALRLAAEDAHLLRRLGLTTVGAVENLPRASLARRFPCRERGGAVLARLDRALGRQADPIVPMVPPPACLERLALPEPLIDRAGLDAMLARLMPGLAAALEREGLGARRLALWCYRVDGGVVRRAIATARATRDGDHLLRLFQEMLETIDPGFGIDLAALHAERVEPLAPAQLSLTGDGRRWGDLDLLVDRLLARLGTGAVCRLEPVARHRPEMAERAVAPGRDPAPWREAPASSEVPATPQRPFRLFDRPEPVDVMAEVPDGPPLLFTWRRVRRRVMRAAGPERIEPEWWAGAGGGGQDEAVRDYYRIEDADGRRYWLYRAGLYGDAGTGGPPRWYVHGLYG
ncbi:MAG: DNA polymerase Y family protein, partial [Rhodospirillales bacterium]|nr:DNA polymerase Y family protein [Rhodospirillales bacterium]